MPNYQALADELANDPLGRGYAGMTDQQAADSLSAEDRPHPDPTLAAGDLFEGIDLTEYNALNTNAKSQVQLILDLGDTIHVGPGTKARAMLIGAFGPTSTTITTLAGMLPQVSRADEIGFGGPVSAEDVGRSR